MLPNWQIEISRALPLPVTPLVLSGRRGVTDLLVVAYQEPERRMRRLYAPPSDDVYGEVLLAAVPESTEHVLIVKPYKAATEAAARGFLDDLRAAIQQFSFTVTITADGATPEVWRCDPGDMTGGERDTVNLGLHDPQWTIVIPCDPDPI